MRQFTANKLADFNDYLRDYKTTPEAYRHRKQAEIERVRAAMYNAVAGSFWSPSPKLLHKIEKELEKLVEIWQKDKNWKPIYKGSAKDAIWVGDKPKRNRKKVKETA